MERCTPWYGRFHKGWSKITYDIASWENCGTTCKNEAKCKSWAWNVPTNQWCAWASKCKVCVHYNHSITINETTSNPDWISGLKNCHTSLSTHSGCNHQGNKNQSISIHRYSKIMFFERRKPQLCAPSKTVIWYKEEQIAWDSWIDIRLFTKFFIFSRLSSVCWLIYKVDAGHIIWNTMKKAQKTC